MNVATFMANFGHLAEAPGGIQRLQEMILELAVQGKVTEQDATEGTGGQQVAEALEERQRLVTKGVLRKTKSTHVSDDEKPFEIPLSWAWSRLATVGVISPRNDEDDNLTVSFVPMKLISEKYGAPPQTEPRSWGSVRSGYTHFAEGDVALAKITPCFQNRKSTVMRGLENGIGAGTTELHIFRPLAGTLVPEYVVIFLKSRRFIETGVRKMTGSAGQKRVPKDYFSKSPFPVPPLAEQHRIVAKVDELMALCDELESQQQQRRAVHVRASEAALDQLTTAANPTEFNTAWSRIRDQFALLYSTPETVTQLREALRQLAVHGRLVAQDVEDESASKLLAEINSVEESENWPSPPVVPFTPPDGWQWANFEDVATIASNLVQPSEYPDVPHIAPNHIEKRTGKLLEYQTVAEDGVRSAKHKFFAGQILYSKIRPNLSKAVSVDFDGLCSADMYPINSHIDSEFLLQYILSETFLSMAVKTDTRVAMPKINQAELKKVLVPVPPLSEQRRITAKLTELMSLCDELESLLSYEATDAKRLTEAMLDTILDRAADNSINRGSDTAGVFELVGQRSHLKTATEHDCSLALGTISCYTVAELHTRKHFGRTPHAKLLSLTQSHVGIDLGIDFQRQEHGPYHPCILELEASAKANKWYRTKRVKTPSGKTKIAYTPGGKIKDQVEQAAAILGDKQPEMDRLLALFAPLTTRKAELYTTTFFVWNDFLIDGTNPTGAQIIEGFFNWHETKRKLFKTEDVAKAIVWLREKELIPTGKGRRTVST